MDSKDTQQKLSEEKLTFSIKKSTRNVFFAKILILLGLTIGGGYLFTETANQQYKRGQELTKEQYIEKFDEYKSSLQIAKQYYDNPLFSTFVMLIVVSFLIGSYELTALIIGFIIGKVIRP